MTIHFKCIKSERGRGESREIGGREYILSLFSRELLFFHLVDKWLLKSGSGSGASRHHPLGTDLSVFQSERGAKCSSGCLALSTHLRNAVM